MKNALISSGSAMLTATSFVGMGDIVTKEVFDWVFSDPKIIKASIVIGRLMDDIVSHEVYIYVHIYSLMTVATALLIGKLGY